MAESRLVQDRLREMSTPELVRQAISELKLLARAELLYAREELKQDLRRARVAGILIGAALALVLCGLTLIFVAIALALPLPEPGATLLVSLVLIGTGAACAALGYRRLPKKPLQHTQQRLKEDLLLTREEFAS
jgi:tetrahydromethanopterin S-methyltransferase subunit F